MEEQKFLKVIDNDGYERGDYEFEISYELIENSEIVAIEEKIQALNEEKSDLQHNIDFLTSHTDKLDIAVSLCSGVLTAVLDALLKEKRIKDIFKGSSEGKDLLDYFNESGNHQAKQKLESSAKSDNAHKAAQKSKNSGNTNYKDSDNSDKAIESLIPWLEKRFNIPSDTLTSEFGGSRQHHLRDFAHHPSIIGLICSMLTQFTEKCYGTNKTGKFVAIKLEGITSDGRMRKTKNGEEIRFIGRDLKEKVFFGITIWYYHLISDLAGSSNTPGQGMGIPGPLMSLAKELSALPIFRKKDKNGEDVNKFSEFISKLYNGTLFAKRDEKGKIIEARKIDARTELGLFKELKDQAIPVILNEIIVRSFYFIRRFVAEIKEKEIHSFSELNKIDIEVVLPFKNRTIVRMMTISTTAFSATNLIIGAAVSGAKSGGNPAMFAKEFVLRINFVGLGKCAVAIGADISSGIKKSKLEHQLMNVNNQIIVLTTAKAQYYIRDTWAEIENTEKAMESLSSTVIMSFEKAFVDWNETKESMNNIAGGFDVITNSLNEAEKKEMLDYLTLI